MGVITEILESIKPILNVDKIYLLLKYFSLWVIQYAMDIMMICLIIILGLVLMGVLFYEPERKTYKG